jgi:hypothetical protein
MSIQVSPEFNEETLNHILDDVLKNKSHTHSNSNINTNINNPEEVFDVIQSNKLLAQHQNELEEVIKSIKASEDNIGAPAGIAALSTLGVIVIYAMYSSWHAHSDYEFFRKLGFSFLMTLMGGLIGFFPAIGMGCLVEKIYMPLWKKSQCGKALLSLKAQKEKDVAQLTQDIKTQCDNLVDEAFYFRTLLKFDKMVARIQAQYEPAFFTSEIFNHRINFAESRQFFTRLYMSGDSVEFCVQESQMSEIETIIEHLWKSFQKSDVDLLEKRYQAFARQENGQPELDNLI